MRLALRVRLEAFAATATERVVQDKVQREQIWRFVTIDLSKTDRVKVLLYPLGRQFGADHLVTGLVISDHSNIATITFVTTASVGNFGKLNFHKLRSLTKSGIEPKGSVHHSRSLRFVHVGLEFCLSGFLVESTVQTFFTFFSRPKTMPNRLSTELSPYLLQHAENPVDWYPWCEEALNRAASEDKPIFLSIGYSACHWCHVMEHESFESPKIAAILNENFVCIKVDREERPDLDQLYMNAVMALRKGGGGWPLSVFLTPKQEVFFGGTYWPPESRMNMPGFDHVLGRVLDAFRTNRDQVDGQSAQITAWLSATTENKNHNDELNKDLLTTAAVSLRDSFDFQNGGFGTAPKFPHSMNLSLLLRLWKNWPELTANESEFGQDQLLEMVELNLKKMAYGGIFDHLAGGFARYSVDEHWLVPHFEKMLYDNGLLATCYFETCRATGKEFFAMIGRKTLDYLLNYMTSPEGGYYSTEDADSEGEEGKFYVWSKAEVIEHLGEEVGERFCRLYNITPQGNFEGHNILNMTKSYVERAVEFGIDKPQLRAEMRAARKTLLAIRDQRVRPGLDDKVLCCWNALGIIAMCEGAMATGEQRYLESAENAFEFVWSKLFEPNRRLQRLWRGGVVKQPAFLDDYSYLLNALYSLYQASLDETYVDRAVELCEQMIEFFSDAEGPGFFFTANDGEQLIARTKDQQDNSVPSGNSMAATALLRWGRLCARQDWVQLAESTIQSNLALMKRAPMASGQMLVALESWLRPSVELVLCLPAEENITEFRDLFNSRWQTNFAMICRIEQSDRTRSKWLDKVSDAKPLVNNEPTLYICRNFSCQAPIIGREKVVQAIEETFAKPLESGDQN